MSGKPVILITGSSKGIGAYLARHYVANGYRVAGCSRGDPEFNDSNYAHWSLDVGDEAAVARMVDGCVEQFGRIDALVNNAGIASMNAALLTPGNTMESIFRTNCFGAFFFAREVAKHMLRVKRGRIVFFTTVARPMRLEGELSYASSKAAVETMAEIFSRELAPGGITVNAVGPSPVSTDLLKGVPQAALDKLISRQAIKRIGEYRDVANVVDFFLQPESDFVTGQIIYLGGVER